MEDAVVIKFRASSKTHPDHIRLTEQERYFISILSHMKLWPKDQIAKTYGVSRKTVHNCTQRYPLTSSTPILGRPEGNDKLVGS